MASTYLKRRLYRSYEKLETDELPEGRFVIFFMHYQPERSSLPEGLFHVQQWIALRQLAWSLPEGWQLLVREHPTTWLQPLDLSVRTASLYEDIAALPNTRICSMQVDTFELIDKCGAVATLTGSVGFRRCCVTVRSSFSDCRHIKIIRAASACSRRRNSRPP